VTLDSADHREVGEMNPRKILIVDDSKLMHKMYEVVLRTYPLIYAQDGRQALDRLRDHRDVDLALIALNLLNMSGLELLAELRKLGSDAPTVVMVTTDGHEEETATALQSGAAAYIKKPFHSEELHDVINRLEDRP